MASKNPETEQAIKEHCADAALRKLVDAGCEESTLLGGLSLMRDCDDSWEGLIGQAYPGVRDLRKRLQSSIKKIRDCAAEMKRLESTALWAQMLYVRSRYSPGSQFDPLSQTLEYYADTWSQVISKTGPKTHPYQSEAKAGLVAYVKERTGHWHDEEVSALIAAATGSPYEAHTHLQWRHANDKLIRHLREAEARQTKHPKSSI